MNDSLRNRTRIDGEKKGNIILAITAACSVALSGGVLPSPAYLLLALASLLSERHADGRTAPMTADVQLQAGIE
jgi:hypothetical protein